MTELEQRIVEDIERLGPLPFGAFMAHALYDPVDGFYSAGGHAGRRGDFITSPEVGPLFGAVIGRALDTWWHELGRPDPFVVVESGAGVGTLARTVLAGAPQCLSALTYVLVEQSESLRSRHGDHLPMTEPSMALPPRSTDDDGIELASTPSASGPRFVSLADLPAIRTVGVVLANEFLDNLVFGLAERTAEGWSEVRVGVDATPRAGEPVAFVEILVPADDAIAALLDRLAPEAPVGGRAPIQRAASDWVRSALERIDRGRLVVLDYASITPDFVQRPVGEWLRTYRGHDRGVEPLAAPGAQDITCEVAVDQLTPVRAPTSVSTQADFLVEHGIDDLVVEGRRIWHERAHIGDLAALTARSRVTEAEALLDSEGLGAFAVVQWQIP